MDTATILDTAKETMLEQGEYVPTLFIEYDKHEIDMCVLLDGPDNSTLNKQKYLFSLGRERGQAHKSQQITQVCMVTEGWASHQKQGEEYPYSRPSDDPKRREVLIIQILDCIPPKLSQSCVIVDIIRDNEGVLRDLFQRDDKMDEVYTPLLTAFLAGALSAKMDERALNKLIDEIAKQHGNS